MNATESSATTVPTLPIKPGAVLVNALLQWPEEDRLALAILLQDSVKERFTSLEQVEQSDKELIRSRLEDLVSGKVPLLDADEVVAELKRRYTKEKVA